MISDPVVKSMNETQWLFELESLHHREEARFDETKVMVDIMRNTFISLLGLDLMPVEEVIGVGPDGENIVRYRRPKDNEIMPLVAYMGREEVMSAVSKRHEEMQIEQDIEETDAAAEAEGRIVHRTPEEIEELMSRVPMFLDDPETMRKRAIWNDPQTQQELAALVTPMNKEKDLEELERDVVAPKKRSKVTIE